MGIAQRINCCRQAEVNGGNARPNRPYLSKGLILLGRAQGSIGLAAYPHPTSRYSGIIIAISSDLALRSELPADRPCTKDVT